MIGATLAFLAIGLCVLGIVYLSADARREIQQLATANSDSSQWTLSQAEIELRAFENALLETPLPVAEVRQRFDVLYARVSILNSGTVFAELRDLPEVASPLSSINAFMASTVSPIDGSDVELADRVPSILAELPTVRAEMREITLQGVALMARQAEQHRQRVASALTRLGVLAFILFAAMLALVVMLARTVRLRREQVLQRTQAEERLKAIVATSLDAILVANRDGQIVDFNDAAERTFGYTREDVIGRSMSETIVPHHLRAAHDEGMKRYLKTGEKHVIGKGRIQLDALRKSGDVFPIEMSISETQGTDGTLFVSYLRDISNRVAKEDELIAARDKAVAGEKAKAELMAVMSHEMRTPLNGILGALDLLQATDLDEKQEKLAMIMGTSGDTLRHHVNDVLEIARDDSDAAEDVFQPFDPVSAVQEVVGSLQGAAKINGNALTVELIGGRSAMMVGDPHKFRRVITNLVGNAIKFTSQGQVVVECDIDGGTNTLELRVIDTGIGISGDDLDRIWDDFVTLDPTFSRTQEGTGLGLAIVRRLVDRMGGKVGVESDLGEGSVFWVRFDLDQTASTSPSPALPNEVKHDLPENRLNILLVEDNEINRFVAKEMLEDLGHKVSEAVDGEDALRAVDERPFDLILMDISMPRMDGVTATRSVRNSAGPNAKTPIIAVTAHALATDVERFEEAGMNDVITKPLERATLRKGLDALQRGAVLRTNHADHLVKTVIDERVVTDFIEVAGRDKFKAALQEWSSEMKTLLEVCGDAAPDDPAGIAKDVHRVAGSAAVFGATGLHRKLASLETELTAQGPVNLDKHVASIERDWNAVRQTLLNRINED